jgi:3-hydroxyacyl-[acyl-carrier protein] dehydratase/trans-2-decenoyl-[acyl-carrier protein] isomerase
VTYAEFQARSHFAAAELLAFANATLVEDAPDGFTARFPLPPMLMVDRIVEISRNGSRGRIVAERDVTPEDWFFRCHFLADPVQPGCLGVDGVWQLIGFFCAWRGGLGTGRALGCGEIAFEGEIRPFDHLMRYDIAIRRCTIFDGNRFTQAIGDATVSIDDVPIYTLKNARVGLFRDHTYDGESAAARARAWQPA